MTAILLNGYFIVISTAKGRTPLT